MISYQTAAPGAPLVEVESATPVPQGAEVLIKTLACGVCHSDIHMHDGVFELGGGKQLDCLLYTSPSPRDRQKSRMPSSA